MTRIATHASPPPAAILYLGLCAALQTGYLLELQRLGEAGLSLAAIAVVVAAFLAVLSAMCLVTVVLRVASFGLLRGDLALSLASGLVTLAVVLARLHYAVFKEHLGAETLRIAVEAVAAGEVALGAGTLASALVFFALCLAGSLLLLRGLGLVSPLAPFARAAEKHRVVLWLAAVALVGVDASVPATTNESVASLRARLPWSAAASLGDAYPDFEIADGRGGVLAFDAAREEHRFESLRAVASLVADGEVRAARRPNIVLIVAESFRWDLVSPDGTPNLFRLQDSCLSAERSYSVGPDTQSGFFGLLNGLSILQYWQFQGTTAQPLPPAILGALGYERTYYYSHFDLDYLELGARFFDQGFDRLSFASGPKADETDAEMVTRFVSDVSRRSGTTPHFDVLTFYSTHWSYDYPETFQRFEPVAPESMRLFHATASSPIFEQAEGLKNRYRNAALYVDHLVGQLVDGLAAAGRLDDTIIIATGDHGEEFFEHGRFGHLWALNDEMTRVPLLMCFPDGRQTRYRFASHADVFPTLFDYMGLSLDASRFMTGKSLLGYHVERDHAILGIPRRRARKRMAIVGADYKIQFRPFGVLRPTAVYDLDDEPRDAFDRAAVAGLMSRIQPRDAATSRGRAQ
jgi:hypothetical protein